MKKMVFLAGLAIVLSSFSYQVDIEPIVRAFKTGNTEEVSKYFDDFVDMKLMDKPEVKNIGRNQANLTLKAFFEENEVKGFEKSSERAIGNTMYMTGKLTNKGKDFGITILMKVKEGKNWIVSIRIN